VYQVCSFFLQLYKPALTFLVRRYVEGTKNSLQLLDLLAAAGGDDAETNSKFEPKALYQEASSLHIAI
jgi:hypothetical protein